MKHFFFPNDERDSLQDILSRLWGKYICPKSKIKEIKDVETLTAYYDVTDIIYDKRFDQNDEQLKKLFEKFPKDKQIENNVSGENISESGKNKFFRLKGLELLWNYIEEQYKLFNTHADETKKPIMLALYHLVRGNLCLRISLCYYENYNLDDSDNWANKGIEILWHGKNLLASLRDTAEEKENVQVDLYLRLTELNLAKYYRDYARKNRRSDFDAALDEYKQVRCRVDDEYKNGGINDSTQKRQYVLIWMDAIINIVKIHRRKYQANTSEKEILFIYDCLKSRLEKSILTLNNGNGSDKNNSAIKDLIEMADTAIGDRVKLGDKVDNEILGEGKDLEGLRKESFEKFDDLNIYDQERYFLLVLLEFARIRRDLHFEDNYKSSIAIAITADQWSRKLDEREKYEPGHNIDALITISSSLRKYIKFQHVHSGMELCREKFVINIGEKEYQLELQEEGTTTLLVFIDKLIEFANEGYLKAKTEIIKWHCLYQQEPELLAVIKEKVESNPYREEKSNCQLYFLQGLATLRSGKYKEASEIFTELLKEYEKEMRYIRLGTLGLKVRYLLANCYMSRAEFHKAEKILKELHETLAVAKKSRENQESKRSTELESQVAQAEIMRQVKKNTDAEPDARVEIDLGYCYMQRGAYEEAIEIYENLYGKGEAADWKPCSMLENVSQLRRVMGLNNYASCCIFSINDSEEKEKMSLKIETARKIFCNMDDSFSESAGGKKDIRYEKDPETNLLKGYYTLCVGVEPEEKPITPEQIKKCQDMFKTQEKVFCGTALLKAFPYFKEACRFKEAFPSRYDLLDEHGMGNKARYRNEVERISAYIISLTKLHKLNLAIENQRGVNWKHLDVQKMAHRLFDSSDEVTELQSSYLKGSKHDLERFLLGFPANYSISLKAAIALAEWLLSSEERLYNSVDVKARNLQSQLYRSFSYITIYEERGARVFNKLKDNSKFRFFNAAQRGKLCALLLAMYKPIKALKEDCCFSPKDKTETPNLVHYTSMETLKKILTEESQKEAQGEIRGEDLNTSEPRFRISNCGYMNDVFEGRTFLKSIALVLGEIKAMKDDLVQTSFIEKYFPQISRSDKNLLPSASNVYIGSLSVKTDSFPMWSVYSAKESGCNIEFGPDFFDINGVPYLPRALRDYTLSQYTDQDYPLYIVQYIGSKFEPIYNDSQKNDKNTEINFETIHTKGYPQSCGTTSICYNDLFRILQQIAQRWKQLDDYLENQLKDAVSESKDVIHAFASDRINEIRFLFKDADYKYEGEVRIIYTDSGESSAAKTNTLSEVPCVYVNIERELKNLTIRMGSRIEDATVDKYVTWLKHTKKVDRVVLASQNRYTT